MENIQVLETTKNKIEEWKKLEKEYLIDQNIKIGVKDFSLKDLQDLLLNAKIKPMIYMVSKEITKELAEFCIIQHIALDISISNIKLDRLHQMEDILLLEQKYQNTTKQIIQRYFYQKQIDILEPIATTFLLSKEEIALLDTLYYWI